MDTKLEICNFSLLLSGAQPLQQLTPENDTRVLGCNTLFDIVLRSESRKHPWNCLMHRKKIAKDETNPDFGFAYRYPLPSNPYCLRPVKINDDLSAVWKVEGRFLLTDETECEMEYIKWVTNLAELDPIFVEAFGIKLAVYFGKKVTGADESVIVDLWKMYKDVIAEARLADWKESSLDAIQVNTLTRARR